MFKLDLSSSYHWPVKVKLPADGGRIEESSFEVEFKRLTQSRIIEITEKVSEKESTFVEVCREIVLGWNQVHDSDKQPVPFSSDALDKLLDIAGVPSAIALAYLDSARGIKAKN